MDNWARRLLALNIIVARMPIGWVQRPEEWCPPSRSGMSMFLCLNTYAWDPTMIPERSIGQEHCYGKATLENIQPDRIQWTPRGANYTHFNYIRHTRFLLEYCGHRCIWSNLMAMITKDVENSAGKQENISERPRDVAASHCARLVDISRRVLDVNISRPW